MAAGYSSTPLLKKLGYRPGDSVYVVNAPKWFNEKLGDADIVALPALPATWAHSFFTWQKEITVFLQRTTLADIEKGLWVSWPKKAAKVPTDITEQTFRDLILRLGWVDSKVVAVDDIWSGLKFLRRKT